MNHCSFFVLAAALALHSPQASAQKTGDTPCGSHADSIEVTDFGARGDARTDNMQPFKAALAYASRCSVSKVHVPGGKFLFIPNGPTYGLQLPSNVVLAGEGVDKTVLQVPAGNPNANFDSLLWARNQDNVEIRDLRLVGSNAVVNNPSGQPLNTYGAAISIALDAKPGAFGNPRDLKHFVVENCQIENFNASAWVRVSNYNDSHVISDVDIRNNNFISRAGNAVNPSNIGFTSFAISVMGSRDSADGLVTQVRISKNTFEATHIKGAVSVWAGVTDIQIADNSILNAGASPAIPDDRGAYGIAVYNNAYHYDKGQVVVQNGAAPDNVHIERNNIVRPRSCGVYTASVNRIWVVGNKVSGQTDDNNKTLPKGAIVMNHPADATVTDNQLSSNRIGVTVLTYQKNRVALSNNSISDVPRGGVASIAPPPTANP